jgi:DNA-binding XRE family transcriptional regulator
MNRMRSARQTGGHATREDVLEARQRAGLTQKEAAAITGVDERTWLRWELGQVTRVRRAMLQDVLLARPRRKRHQRPAPGLHGPQRVVEPGDRPLFPPCQYPVRQSAS